MDKRQKVKILSFIMGVTLLLSHGLNLQDSSLAALFSAVVIYFGLYWVLEFNVIGLRLIFVFILPILFDFMFVQQSLGLESSLNRDISSGIFIVVAIIFSILNYVIILTANILNVASIRKIPLLQVAQTSAYFFSVFLLFLVLSFVQGLGYSIFFNLILIFIFSFIVMYQLFWFIVEGRSLLFWVTMVCAMSLALVYEILSFFPISYVLLNISISALVYVFGGLVMHSAKKSLRGTMLIEYFVTLVILLVIIFATSDWGSFGSLLTY